MRKAASRLTLDPQESRLPRDLLHEITRAGFYPKLVNQILEVALGDEHALDYLVQLDTTFDETIRRHLTVLVLTETRLIAGHVDDSDDSDNPEAEADAPPIAMGTTEAIPLSQIRSVGLTHVVSNPAHTSANSPKPPAQLVELNLAINWGGVSRLEVGAATCGDPDCEGDHGYLGAAVPDDLVVRVAAAAEGAEATVKALTFARALSAASARNYGGALAGRRRD